MRLASIIGLFLPVAAIPLVTGGCAGVVGRVVLVKDGAPRAAVILPDSPIPAHEFAAEELIYHVRKATGVELPRYHESATPADAGALVYIGSCQATAAVGIDLEVLPPSGHVVQTSGNALFLAGKDRDRGRIGGNWQAGWQGTLYAVYDLLETELGVRWLWPGELGEHVPKRTDVVISPVQRQGTPHFRQAWMRAAGAKGGHLPGWSSPEAKDAYHEAQRLFMIRHRFGAVQNMDYGHAFSQYWQRFGETNPEFFSLLPDGTRRPLEGDAGKYITMCVSNPGFQRKVIETWTRSRERNPEHIPHRPYLNACENDTPGMCTCGECRAWDAPDPAFETHDYWGKGIVPDRSRRFTLARAEWGELPDGETLLREPPSLSDRYARFYAELLRQARAIDPEARVAGYAYANYTNAPRSADLDLDGVLIVNVGGFWFPDGASDKFKANWEGWRRLGAEQLWRPNLTHAGANLPIFYARPFANFFSFAAANGMVGTMFDSLLGAWSAQGPTLYTIVRIHQHPDWPVERILDEYYASFGQAETGVRAYFGYWEQHSATLDPEEVRRYGQEEQGGSFKNYVRIAHRLFAPEDFAPARALLDTARRQAGNDDRALRRVAYLEQGLTDAELTTATRAAQARMEEEDSEANRAAFDAAFRKLLNHRAVMEASGTHPANVGYFAFREQHGARWPHLQRPNEAQLAHERAFQDRWPEQSGRELDKTDLRLTGRQSLPRTAWRFRKDPERRGDLLGWQRPETNIDDWQEVAIETAWESFLGEPYIGAGWYRRTIEAPEWPADGAVYLHFGGVDESCWTWVNGQYVGRHHIGPDGWNVPFRLELTPALRPGKNELVVRVMNTAYAGGIWRPAQMEMYGPAR